LDAGIPWEMTALQSNYSWADKLMRGIGWHSALGRSGPVVRNLIGPEQQCKALENVAHFARSQNPDAVDEPSSIDSSDLGDVYDTCPWKSCLTST